MRFAYQLSMEDLADPVGVAQRAETLGFDAVVVGDHVGPGLAPMPVLAAIAEGTESIRLGTMVLNNDMRNPVQLAWETVTLDGLSGGRFELGLGAGHTPQEYSATGIEWRPPAQRKAALCEAVEVIRPLLDGQAVSFDGEHYVVHDAAVDGGIQDRIPILVGGNGAALLEHAGAHADIIGLQGLGRTLEDGHRHEGRWSLEHLEAQIGQIRQGAAGRFEDLELNALVQITEVTDDPVTAVDALVDRVDGLTHTAAAATPYLLIGSVGEIVDKLRRVERDWGITYFTVRALDPFAPIIDVLR